MGDEQHDDEEPTQETQPAKGEPVEIPVPDKADVMAALRKVAKTDAARDSTDGTSTEEGDG